MHMEMQVPRITKTFIKNKFSHLSLVQEEKNVRLLHQVSKLQGYKLQLVIKQDDINTKMEI